MIRALFVLALIALLAFAGAWLADNPGSVHVDWGDWRIDTSLGALTLGVLALTGAAVAVLRVIGFFISLPYRLAKIRHERRMKRGYAALSRGLVAVASQDGAAALRESRRAAALLDQPALTLLLQAEAARAAGDRDGAVKTFHEMLENRETRLLGLKGLANDATERGDDAAAQGFVEQARGEDPKAGWAIRDLFALQIRRGRWADAEDTLERAVKADLFDAADAKHKRAVLRFERSRDAEAEGLVDAALDHARASERLDEDFLPATLRVADLLVARGRGARAARLLEKAWERQPHRLIAERYATLVADETALERVIRLEKLRALHPNHPETHVMLGTASLKAGLWGEARTHLGRAAEADPSRTTFMALAELAELGDDDAPATRRYLERAAGAPLDPAWICHACDREAPQYLALCPACGAFDSYRWGPHGWGPQGPGRAGRDRLAPAAARLPAPEAAR